MVGHDGGEGFVDRVGVLAEVATPERGERLEAEHGVAVALAVEKHDMPHGRDEPVCRTQFRQLCHVFGEDDDGRAVGEDVVDVLGVRARIDGGGRGADERDGKVGQDPFEAGGRGDGDPLFVLDAEGEQAGGELPSVRFGAGPGERAPRTVVWCGRAERLAAA
jgi:hypothetical protein